jgi:hypothetical protein
MRRHVAGLALLIVLIAVEPAWSFVGGPVTSDAAPAAASPMLAPVEGASEFVGRDFWIYGDELIEDPRAKPRTTMRVKTHGRVKVLEVEQGRTIGTLKFIWVKVQHEDGLVGWLESRKLKDLFMAENPRVAYGWSPQVWQDLEKKTLKIGMDEHQALIAWGLPTKKNRTTAGKKVSEQWIYRERDAYVYLEDGVVRSIQENGVR